MSTDTTTDTQQPTADRQAAMLRRIQGLLTKAADPAASPEESETYMAKATELMAKYSIDQAMLNATKPKAEREQVVKTFIVMQNPYAQEKRTLLHRIGEAFGVHTVHLTGSKPLKVFMVGYPSDIERVESMFASLALQATRDMLKTSVPYWEHTAAFRRTFLLGFAHEVGDRLAATYRKVEQQETAATPGTALVLVDRRQAVEAAVKEYFPSVRHDRRRLSGGGMDAGRQSGRRADIGGNKVGGGRQALPR